MYKLLCFNDYVSVLRMTEPVVIQSLGCEQLQSIRSEANKGLRQLEQSSLTIHLSLPEYLLAL